MSITIYKYPLTLHGIVNFKEADEVIPIQGLVRLLHVGEDPSGELCVWAMINKNDGTVRGIKICVRGTGHDCDDVETAQHLGSLVRGPYVWHIFAKEAA